MALGWHVSHAFGPREFLERSQDFVGHTDLGMPVMKEQMYCAHSPLNSIGGAHHARALGKVPVLVRQQSVQGKVPLRGTNGLGIV